MRTPDVKNDEQIRRTLVADPDLGFTMLVKQYQPAVYSGARRLTHRHEDAEEVAQEAFLRAYRALQKYTPERIKELKLRPWLWTIALNLCRDRWSAGGRLPTHGDTGHATIDADPLDVEVWTTRLDRLPEAQRTAVVLRHVVDLPIAEISTITDRPHGTVKADISRGLERLRSGIAKEAHR